MSSYNFPDGIVKHMKSKAGPTAKELKSAADMDKFIGGNDQVLVGRLIRHIYS